MSWAYGYCEGMNDGYSVAAADSAEIRGLRVEVERLRAREREWQRVTGCAEPESVGRLEEKS
jgi:hypothetical protein